MVTNKFPIQKYTGFQIVAKKIKVVAVILQQFFFQISILKCCIGLKMRENPMTDKCATLLHNLYAQCNYLSLLILSYQCHKTKQGV